MTSQARVFDDAPAPAAEKFGAENPQIIFVVDDEFFARDMICQALARAGRTIVAFDACEAFLEAYRPGGEACLVLDVQFAGMGGVELLHRLRTDGHHLPTVVVSGSSNIPIVVEAMKAGAVDFIEKPIRPGPLQASVERALGLSRAANKENHKHDAAVDHVAGLTPRQREIMILIVAGHPNKNIAADLGISQRTVETHRAAIMKKTGAASLPALARIAVAASWIDPDES